MSWLLACLALAARPAGAQVQEVGFDDAIPVESTTAVVIESIVVAAHAPFDVALVAHVYAEGSGFDHERYEIAIRQGSATGTIVGRAIWRPGDKTEQRGSFEADTIAVTGFAAAVAAPTRYVLSARRLEADGPTVTIYPRGLNATTAPAGTTVRGFQVTDDAVSFPISSTSPVSLGSLAVDADAGSDVLLTAHVGIEGLGLGGGASWAIGICRGSVSGPKVGSTLFRPPASADGGSYQADTVALTGFDPGVQGSVTYVLCGAKSAEYAPNVSARLLGMHAVTAPTGTTLAGVEQVEILPSADLTESRTSLASVQVASADAYSVRLAGHVYLEGAAWDGSRYDVGICRGDASGPLVGRTYWRPETRNVDIAFVGDTLAVTGWDPGRHGATTYLLCARAADSGAPLATAFSRGLVAEVPEPGSALALAGAVSALAIVRRARGWRRGRDSNPRYPYGYT